MNAETEKNVSQTEDVQTPEVQVPDNNLPLPDNIDMEEKKGIIEAIARLLDKIHQLIEAFEKRYPLWAKHTQQKAIHQKMEKLEKNIEKLSENSDIATQALADIYQNGYATVFNLDESLKEDDLDGMNEILDNQFGSHLKNALTEAMADTEGFDIDTLLQKSHLMKTEKGNFYLVCEDDNDIQFIFSMQLKAADDPKNNRIIVSRVDDIEVCRNNDTYIVVDTETQKSLETVTEHDFFDGSQVDAGFIAGSIMDKLAKESGYTTSDKINKATDPKERYVKYINQPQTDAENGGTVSMFTSEDQIFRVFDEKSKTLMAFKTIDGEMKMELFRNTEAIDADLSDLQGRDIGIVQNATDTITNTTYSRLNINVPLGDILVQRFLRDKGVETYFLSKGISEQSLKTINESIQSNAERKKVIPLENRKQMSQFVSTLRDSVYTYCSELLGSDILQEMTVQATEGSKIRYLTPDNSEFEISLSKEGTPDKIMYKPSDEQEFHEVYIASTSNLVISPDNYRKYSSNDKFFTPLLDGAVKGINIQFYGYSQENIKPAAENVISGTEKDYSKQKDANNAKIADRGID